MEGVGTAEYVVLSEIDSLSNVPDLDMLVDVLLVPLGFEKGDHFLLTSKHQRIADYQEKVFRPQPSEMGEQPLSHLFVQFRPV